MRNKILIASVAAGLLAAGLSMTARADYKSTVLTDNPSGYWRLNAWPVAKYATNIGSAVGVDGVIGNFTALGQPGAIAGDANGAMYFGGLGGNTRVTVPYSYELNASYPGFTFECWTKLDCKQGNALAIAVNRSGESGFTIYPNNGDGSFSFNVSKGAGGGFWTSVSIPGTNVAPLIGTWIHVACVFNATNSTYGDIMVYTNGVLAGANILTNSFVPNPSGAFLIGDRDFAGLLDEVAYYDVPLPPATIAAHRAAGISGSGNYQATILADAPKGYWRLGETGAFSIQPSSAANVGTLGQRGNGTYSVGTPLQQTGAMPANANKSAYFDGSKLMQSPPGLCSPAAPFTVECWVKPDVAYSGATAQAVPLGGTDRDFGRSGWLFYQGGNGWSWWLGNTSAYTITMDPVTTVVAGNWYHLVGTYDGATAILYVNGVQVASSNSALYSVNFSQPVTVGGRYDSSFFFRGAVDEVAIYTNLLSAAEVLAHYQNGINTTPSSPYDTLVLAQNPLAYWRMDDTAVPFASAVNLGYIGSAGNGAYVGATPIATNDTPLVGDSDPALYFADSSRIDLPLSEALVRTNAFSYEIWYKENGGVTSIRCPMWWRDEPAGGDTRGWVHYLQDLTGGRGHNFQSSSTATTWDGMWVVPSSFVQDQWQHLVCTWDGLVKKIYLDGALVQVSTNDPRNIKPVQRAVCSINSRDANYAFRGFLDEAAYYTNALSHERVVAHYAAARGANPPIVGVTFLKQPLPVSGFEGATVTIKTIVLGTLPFSYQWYKDTTTPVAGQTSANLTLSPALQSQTGDYTLWVTNGAGAVSSDTVHVDIVAAPPTIVQEPQPASRLQGASVTFTVVAGGSEPLSYQWKSNSVAIPGATSATLTLANVQPSYAANYSVTVNNTAGTKDSAAAALTVQATTPGGIAATIVADNPRAYWRLSETTGNVAYDLAGGHDGTYDPGMGIGVPGGVLGDPDKAANFPGYAGIQVPFSTDLNPSIAFTVECWARADALSTGSSRTLFASRNREQTSNWHFGYYVGVDTADQWQFNTGHKTSGVRVLTGGIADTNWHHIVCTYDDATLTKNLYVDGQLVAFDNPPLNTFAANLGFGTLLDDPPPTDEGIGTTVAADRYAGSTVYFWGDMDEVAVYGYALTPAQVAKHYTTAGPPSVSIGKDGANVVVSWNKGLLLQAPAATGPWTTNTTAVSPWTNAPAGTQQYYRALVP